MAIILGNMQENQDCCCCSSSSSSSSAREEDLMDSVLCVSGSRIVLSGLLHSQLTDSPAVIFVNSGGGAVKGDGNVKVGIQADGCFEGGDVLRTDESMSCGGDLPCIYQSARFGNNFCYQFHSLSAGEYLVDLHFAEIVNVNGPKGMRVFDVFVQEEKVLSELDIYSIVGANKALQVVDIRVIVRKDGAISMKFEGVLGSPIICGICIRKAPELPESMAKLEDYLICNNCAAEVRISPSKSKVMRMNSIAKYEKRIQELNAHYRLKADECYEAWMSLTAANRQLEKVKMELDNSFFQNMRLDQALEKQKAKLKGVSTRYEQDQRLWTAAFDGLERKIREMKMEHSRLSQEAHDCVNSVPGLNKMTLAVQALVTQHDDLKFKFNEEQLKRKKLYNQLQEARGNIRVFCRCRPLTKEESSAGHQMVVDFSTAKDGDLGIQTTGSTKKMFKFDRVYTPKDDQVDVFADASPLTTSVLDGYNVCIFAYGQTGTGKTFTMDGTPENRGVNYRTLEQLFETAEYRKETVTYDISVSVLEVYNEQIRDLLAISPTAKRLEIKQSSEGVHHVPGMVEAKVENIKEVWDVLQAGANARAVGSNNVNERSSRSHCMLCTVVRGKNLVNGECTKSKLWLVDLAGSERLAKTEVQGERLKEAQNINRSLSALGDVIAALATKNSHIPYRNSKLTHLLHDSLGGDSKTLMFVQISPSQNDLCETLSSLNFATRVRGVELGPTKKQIDTGEIQKLRLQLDKMKHELKSKDDTIRMLDVNFQNIEAKTRGKDQLCRNQQEKVTELESQLASKTELCRQLESRLLQLSEGMKGKEEICSNFQHKVNKLENKLKERGLADSRNLQQMVKELENKLKTERDNSEFQLLHQKIKVLEEKVRQNEQEGECATMPPSTEMLQATPTETKAPPRGDKICDTDPCNKRSLNYAPRRLSQESNYMLKGADSLGELRKKRDVQSKGRENSFMFATTPLTEKVLTAESNRPRRVDSSKALGSITRNAKPVNSAQRALPSSNGRINRAHATGSMKDNKMKIWLR